MLVSDDKVRARGLEIVRNEATLLNALLSRAQRLANNETDELINIAERISQAITPYTPCKNGCSNCCYMGVAVSDFEAEAISRFTGRIKATKGELMAYVEREGGSEDYATVPCTFLIKGKCSIYPVRPIACRTHHNLNDDESNCVIKLPLLELTETTPSLDLGAFQAVVVKMVINRGEGFADIREYFP